MRLAQLFLTNVRCTVETDGGYGAEAPLVPFRMGQYLISNLGQDQLNTLMIIKMPRVGKLGKGGDGKEGGLMISLGHNPNWRRRVE